jgi:DNA-directed RNA polymerase
VYGEDKLSEDDREQWVRQHEDIIKLIDECPEGEAQMEFWTKADKPFQFLAFCFDYAAYLRDPEHKSHLICHIDQTCSGLQHWSAVLKDGEGGAQVGMINKPMPDDIYQAVADRVEVLLEVMNDDPMAVSWQGLVTRQITKRNVMTKLYGATLPGMRDQVINELAKLDKKAEGGRYLKDCPEDNFKAAKFIAELNNRAMQDVISKATQGMDYVQKVSRALAESGHPTKWTSPIGLPIRQTYWQTRTKRVNTYWISVDVGRMQMNVSLEKTEAERKARPEKAVQVRKSEQSIAPNFIHSMDASHLLFIALAWKDQGKALTTVHDSFGTHASELTLRTYLSFTKLSGSNSYGCIRTLIGCTTSPVASQGTSLR